jgi:hypothetical protein
MLPQLAQGEANKIFIIPSEFSQALGNLGNAFAGRAGGGESGDGPPPPPRRPRPRVEGRTDDIDAKAAADAAAAAAAAQQATAEAEGAATYSPPDVGAPADGEPPAQPPPSDAA